MKTLSTTCDFGADAPMGSPTVGRADRVVQQLTGLSRSGVRGLFDHGCVTINDAIELKPQTTVRNGDRVAVRFDPHRQYREVAKPKGDPAFDLLFEDARILVVNKAAHVLTVPTATDKGKSLIEALEKHVNRGKSQRKPSRLHVVQRLDRGVSGVLVFAKSQEAAADLRSQFESHKPDRRYVAIVYGTLDQQRGTFKSYLATGRTLNRYSTKSPNKGELAITHYRVIAQRFGTTAVEVRLETGRRNQIRVHFAEAGHPVLGDRRYQPELASHPRWNARRLALHAASLEFLHPITGKPMRFEAPLPNEFDRFLK